MPLRSSPPSGTPLVSVVIPCYNAQRYIGATIASVLAQKDIALEIIVVDDGSSDESVALVRKGFPAVRIIEQANAGVAAARNTGIAAARGKWVAFVDADDIWLPGKLAAQLDQVGAMPECRLCYTAWKVWPSDVPQPTPDYLARLQEEAGDSARWRGATGWIYPQLLLDCVVWTSTVLMQRSLLAELNGFDTTLRLGEDYDLWLRASRITPIYRVARPYALYRMHPASITRATPAENYRARVIGQALGRWGLASPDGRTGDAGAVRRMLAKSWSDFAGAHLQARNLGQARRAALAALRSDPTHVPGWKVLVKTGLKALSPSKEKT